MKNKRLILDCFFLPFQNPIEHLNLQGNGMFSQSHSWKCFRRHLCGVSLKNINLHPHQLSPVSKVALGQLNFPLVHHWRFTKLHHTAPNSHKRQATNRNMISAKISMNSENRGLLRRPGKGKAHYYYYSPHNFHIVFI